MDTMEEVHVHELEIALKPIYGILDEEDWLIDVTLEETEHHLADIPVDMSAEDYRVFLELDTYEIKVENGTMFITGEKERPDQAVIHYQEVLQRLETLEETVKTLQLTIDNLTGEVEHDVEIETED